MKNANCKLQIANLSRRNLPTLRIYVVSWRCRDNLQFSFFNFQFAFTHTPRRSPRRRSTTFSLLIFEFFAPEAGIISHSLLTCESVRADRLNRFSRRFFFRRLLNSGLPSLRPAIPIRWWLRSLTAFSTNQRAMYWQSPEGINFWPYVYANKWMFEDKMEQNPPRWARVYALIAASMFDSFIASQDGKFTYWYIRPNQLDPAIVPLFPVPNFPSYPSNHSTFSATRSEILAYLFPSHADEIRAIGAEGGDSRIWAGIHYQIDNVAGVDLGKAVARKFVAWANADNSQ